MRRAAEPEEARRARAPGLRGALGRARGGSARLEPAAPATSAQGGAEPPARGAGRGAPASGSLFRRRPPDPARHRCPDNSAAEGAPSLAGLAAAHGGGARTSLPSPARAAAERRGDPRRPRVSVRPRLTRGGRGRRRGRGGSW